MAQKSKLIKNEDFIAVVVRPRRWMACGDLTMVPGEEPKMHYVPTSERARNFSRQAATPGEKNLWDVPVSIIADEDGLTFAVRTSSPDLNKELAEKGLARLTKLITDFEVGSGGWD